MIPFLQPRCARVRLTSLFHSAVLLQSVAKCRDVLVDGVFKDDSILATEMCKSQVDESLSFCCTSPERSKVQRCACNYHKVYHRLDSHSLHSQELKLRLQVALLEVETLKKVIKSAYPKCLHRKRNLMASGE